jgi:sporulation protein YlmC with PRC-barrel domain
VAKMEIISTKIKSIDKLKTLRSYLGKTVISKSGEPVGKIVDIIAKDDVLAGMILSGDIFIDKEFIESDSGEALMLSIDPITSIVGMVVFDADARKIGKVIGLERKANTNSFTGLIVKKRIYTKPFIVPKQDINTFKKNVVLRKVYS